MRPSIAPLESTISPEVLETACAAIFKEIHTPGSDPMNLWWLRTVTGDAKPEEVDAIKSLVQACLDQPRGSQEEAFAMQNLRDFVAQKLEALPQSVGGTSEIASRADQLLLERTAFSRGIDKLSQDASTYVLNGLPKLGRFVAGIAPLVGGVWLFWNPLTNVLNQLRFDLLSGMEIGARNGGVTTVDGKDLEGATIRFACAPVGAEGAQEWNPVDVKELWTSQRLEHPFFGVKFDSELGLDGSIVHAGWASTVRFTPEQTDLGLPDLLGAKTYEAVPNLGTVATLPTGAFMSDVMSIIDGKVFRTGERAADGLPMQYYLVDPAGELLCDGPAPKDSKPYMETATLALTLTERGLGDFLPEGEHLIFATEYQTAFDAFGLGEWYKLYYSGLDESLDIALRNASSRGVKKDRLQALVDYFHEREFEKNLLRELRFLKSELDAESFAYVIENVKNSRTHSFDLSNTHEMKLMNAAGLHHPGAAGSKIDIRSDVASSQVGNVATHEFAHALMQGDPQKNIKLEETFDRNSLFLVGGDQDAANLVFEGMTEWLNLVGHGKVSKKTSSLASEGYAYKGRVDLMHFLYQKGQLTELVKIYTLHPDRMLTPAQQDLIIQEWGFPLIESPRTAHFLSVLFEVIGLENEESAEIAKTKGKQIYHQLLTVDLTDDQTEDGQDKVDRAATTILELIR